MDYGVILRALAGALVLAALVNGLFVWRAIRRYLRVPAPRSRILTALVVIQVAVWAADLVVAAIAFRVLLELDPLPGGGILLGVVIIVLSAIPHYVDATLRRVETDGGDGP